MLKKSKFQKGFEPSHDLSVRRQARYPHSHWGFAGNDVRYSIPVLTHFSYLAAAGKLPVFVGIDGRLPARYTLFLAHTKFSLW